MSRGNALPPTGSSQPRTMPLSRSTLGMWMRMVCTMANSPPLLSLGLSVLRATLMAHWTGCGRRGKLRSSSRPSSFIRNMTIYHVHLAVGCFDFVSRTIWI